MSNYFDKTLPFLLIESLFQILNDYSVEDKKVKSDGSIEEKGGTAEMEN